jgi:hypothetical protein
VAAVEGKGLVLWAAPPGSRDQSCFAVFLYFQNTFAKCEIHLSAKLCLGRDAKHSAKESSTNLCVPSVLG